MATRRRKRTSAANGKGPWIHVKLPRSQWRGFTDAQVQDLLGKHMNAKKGKKQRGKKQPEAHIYLGMGKNPMSFAITICPQYPCSM